MKILFVIATLFVPSILYSQQTPYNKEFAYRIITNYDELARTDSIQALIINFESEEVKGFTKTLQNNPQVKELKFSNPTQAAIDISAQLLGESLTHLIIEDYFEDSITIPNFSSLEYISISSNYVKSIDMSESTFEALYILAINSESLFDWKSPTHFEELGLIDLVAPKLENFPIKSAPRLNQFSFYCSLNEIPAFLCECEELELMSFENFKNIEVDECLKQKVYNGYYSNLKIRDGEEGPVVIEWLSKDRQ